MPLGLRWNDAAVNPSKPTTAPPEAVHDSGAGKARACLKVTISFRRGPLPEIQNFRKIFELLVFEFQHQRC